MSMLLFDESVNNSSKVIYETSLDSTIKSHSDNSEIGCIERIIDEVMNQSVPCKVINSTGLFNELIESLVNQISCLKEEVKFLREDAIKKSDIINKLITKAHSCVNGRPTDVSTVEPVLSTPQVVNVRVSEDCSQCSSSSDVPLGSYFEFPRLDENNEEWERKTNANEGVLNSNPKL